MYVVPLLAKQGGMWIWIIPSYPVLNITAACTCQHSSTDWWCSFCHCDSADKRWQRVKHFWRTWWRRWWYGKLMGRGQSSSLSVQGLKGTFTRIRKDTLGYSENPTIATWACTPDTEMALIKQNRKNKKERQRKIVRPRPSRLRRLRAA